MMIYPDDFDAHCNTYADYLIEWKLQDQHVLDYQWENGIQVGILDEIDIKRLEQSGITKRFTGKL